MQIKLQTQKRSCSYACVPYRRGYRKTPSERLLIATAMRENSGKNVFPLPQTYLPALLLLPKVLIHSPALSKYSVTLHLSMMLLHPKCWKATGMTCPQTHIVQFFSM